MKINYITQRGNQNPTNEFNIVEEDPSSSFNGKVDYVTQRGNQNPTNEYNIIEGDAGSSFDAENNENTSQFDNEFSEAIGKKRKKAKKKKSRFGKSGGLLANFRKNQEKRNKRKDEQAKAQTIAARQLAKTDPADVAMAKALESSNTPAVEAPKSKTMLYVGIGAIVLILGIGGFIAYKKFKNK
jgi:hypothetical protein